jgi:hypothetical protein
MTELVRISPKIAAHVDAALAAGFTVYAVPSESLRPAGFVALCLDEDGPWAHIQQPTNSWDPVQLDVPITPHKDYGSAVHVDHDGTPEDAVRALRQACSEDTVTVRFMTRQYIAKHGVPKVPNAGRKAMSYWADRMVKLGKRGTNWIAPQLAGRLEIGDRFDATRPDGRDWGIVTVTGKRYSGEEYVILTTAEHDFTIELRQHEFVTLLGAA